MKGHVLDLVLNRFAELLDTWRTQRLSRGQFVTTLHTGLTSVQFEQGADLNEYEAGLEAVLQRAREDFPFVTAVEYARRRGVSSQAVYNWVRLGRLNVYELGGRQYFLDNVEPQGGDSGDRGSK